MLQESCNLANKIADLIKEGYKYCDIEKEKLESLADDYLNLQGIGIWHTVTNNFNNDLIKFDYVLAVNKLKEFLIKNNNSLQEEDVAIIIHNIIGSLLEKDIIKKYLSRENDDIKDELFLIDQCQITFQNIVDITNKMGKKLN